MELENLDINLDKVVQIEHKADIRMVLMGINYMAILNLDKVLNKIFKVLITSKNWLVKQVNLDMDSDIIVQIGAVRDL